MPILIVDAGVLYAVVDAKEARQQECLELLEHWEGRVVVPTLVITEVMHFVGTRLGPRSEALLLADFASGHLSVEPVASSDWERIAELVIRYADFPLGTVDASVVAAAERLGAIDIATFDHRHFRAVRPRHVEAFTLHP